MEIKKLNDTIYQMDYILCCLTAYRGIIETGRDCNGCAAARVCEYAPKPGEQVRYNCPHYVEPKTEQKDSITCTNEVKAHDTTTNDSENPNITPAYVINADKKEIIAQAYNGDTISRQAALDALNCNIGITGRKNAEKVAEMLKLFTTRIKGLPAEGPKLGKWIKKDTRNDLYECSKCGLVTYSESLQNLKEFERFCSRCGARLEVDEDDT